MTLRHGRGFWAEMLSGVRTSQIKKVNRTCVFKIDFSEEDSRKGIKTNDRIVVKTIFI